jgi:iron complex outermembrane recepter protein
VQLDPSVRQYPRGIEAQGVRRFLLCALCAAPIIASADLPIDPLDEIVVTARKARELLSDVPLAIRVISSQELRVTGVDGLQTLADQVPGLYFESMWGGSNAAPTLRGQAQPNQSGNNVSVFVDGVYQANSSGLDTSMLDLDRIEVIKGPQSSLYGRSTFSGAISYVSRRPSDIVAGELLADAGSNDYRSLSATLSGPVGATGVLARVSVGLQEFDGTGINLAEPQNNLGGYAKSAASMSLTYALSGWEFAANMRFSENRSEQPAVSTLTAADYNCGSLNAVSGQWTYFCGNAPRTTRYAISSGIPDSETRTLQAAVQMQKRLSEFTLESLSTYYRSSSDDYQDYDETSSGSVYGVCIFGVTCNPSADGAQSVARFVNVNQVALDSSFTEEISEELRTRYRQGRFQSMFGALLVSNRTTSLSEFGASPSVPLSPNERLTELLAAAPTLVGPMSILNRFLVSNPNVSQRVLSPLDIEHRHFSDVFGSADFALTSRLNLHGELRVGLFDSSSATTPRVSLDYHLPRDSLVWVSAAKGQNPGGSNHDPTLISSEQNYGPEWNWTYEVGFRSSLYGGLLKLDAAIFYIDWRNSQIVEPSNSPGDHGFITRNVSGIKTEGIEWAADIQLPRDFSAKLGYSYDDAHFKSGSEDLGGIKFCGIEDGRTTSNFCTIGPSRSVPFGAGPLVPYVDGNILLRSPQQQWTAALNYAPPALETGLKWFARTAVTHQGSVYFRPIDGASNGERTLLNAGLGISRDRWSVNLWGSNLTDVTYIRAVASRGPMFFPAAPRPHDLIYGDRRRFAMGLSWGF